MATFQEIKNKVHDGSGIKNPNQWNWYTVGGIWYPEYLLPEQEQEQAPTAIIAPTTYARLRPDEEPLYLDGKTHDRDQLFDFGYDMEDNFYLIIGRMVYYTLASTMFDFVEVSTDVFAREQAIQQAKDLLKKEGYIIRYWHKDDLNGHFEEGQSFADKPKLTEEEIENIVRYLENIDAEIGINHHSVFDTIENELSNREEN